MKYYGCGDEKRYEMIGRYNYSDIEDNSSPIGFIKNKGMLIEFLNTFRKNGGNSHLSNLRNKRLVDVSPIARESQLNIFERFEVDGLEYISEICDEGVKEYYDIYRELKNIADDKYFKWKKNDKHGSLESKIVDGNFEFCCVAKQDGDAIVDIKYCKCENKHRNRVTIERIEVQNATNDDILDAIKLWKKEFRKELAA